MDIIETVKCGLNGLDVFSIGKSECGNDILCAHAGGGGRQIIITAAIHARECYTALVALEQARRFASKSDGVYFVPLVNPDGAAFFESGRTYGREFLKRNLALCKKWKANARGVDLNTNFDANWGHGKNNVFFAGKSDYVGERPFCERESAALASFTRRVGPIATVSYHCMGGELYWEFFQKGGARERDEAFAAAVAKHIGVKKIDGDLGSAGGYKDWCIKALGIPAVTVELIQSGDHPFSPEDFTDDIQKNRDLPEFIFDIL